MNKTLMTALVSAITLMAGHAFAADGDCAAKAADKKLAGAAKTSFVKKCEKDAGMAAATPNEACVKASTEKKLAGAAKKSFMTKCEKDAAAAKS